MKRSLLKVQMGQKKVQEVVRVEGDDMPGPDDGVAGFQALWFFVQSLQTNPTLLRHSVDCPSEVSIKYNGRTWYAESRAVVDADAS
mgnify:CR=1 FL=1